MTLNDKGHLPYVHQVREETRSYILELLQANEKLRLRLATLEGEVESGRAEKLDLEVQLTSLRDKQERFTTEHDRLQERITEAEMESQHFSSRFVQVEQRNSDLANLYVASYRLHETVDREEVLTALQEIIVNLVGCESFAILETAPGRPGLGVAASMGLDGDRLAELVSGNEEVAQAVRTGEISLAPEGANGRPTEGLHLWPACRCGWGMRPRG